jgi:hypothetical protein
MIVSLYHVAPVPLTRLSVNASMTVTLELLFGSQTELGVIVTSPRVVREVKELPIVSVLQLDLTGLLSGMVQIGVIAQWCHVGNMQPERLTVSVVVPMAMLELPILTM